ncbi:cation:proton antiporter [Clostridium lacusfryxellense]|uniref:cation:proton antiporter n=1 Tax=Clostridium lacusfryxellense TaxID=205328 RepID=UPI001C0B086C|nr:cation:proton antiporter [Clostridium lacusfryxellense]MBU3111217.1 cation:proton antiporter [Clostridium lacusfryxellense]
MLDINFLLDLAIILISTKVLGLLTKKIQMPQVVGALIAGLILGPTILNVVHETAFIDKMAELGVIGLMFIAGLETDVKEMKKCGKSSFVIALLGVLIPLGGGFLVAIAFSDTPLSAMSQIELLKNIFIGVILTATSVSITVETLREMGKLKTPTGTAILGAAVIDDIIGIILFTIILGFADPSIGVMSILIRILLFFVFAIIIAIVFNYVFKHLSDKYVQKRRVPIYGMVFCLMLSYVSEKFFGITDITGAYLAGIIISNVNQSDYILGKFEVLSYMLLSPIFFASIGIKTHITGISSNLLIFTTLLLLVAILSKIIGCGLGAKLTGFTNENSLKIGIGMISRGEVALIVAGKGAVAGLMSKVFFVPVVIVVIVTTLLTPMLLKLVYKRDTISNIEKYSS